MGRVDDVRLVQMARKLYCRSLGVAGIHAL